jgi:hypothetical protein
VEWLSEVMREREKIELIFAVLNAREKMNDVLFVPKAESAAKKT